MKNKKLFDNANGYNEIKKHHSAEGLFDRVVSFSPSPLFFLLQPPPRDTALLLSV
jgi:hypothetical protein